MENREKKNDDKSSTKRKQEERETTNEHKRFGDGGRVKRKWKDNETGKQNERDEKDEELERKWKDNETGKSIWYTKKEEIQDSIDALNTYTLIISDDEWATIDWDNISKEKITELAYILSEPPMDIYEFIGYKYIKELIPKGVAKTLAYVDTQALTKASKNSYGVIKIDEKTLYQLDNGTVSVRTNYLDTITNKESTGTVKVYPEGTQSEHIFGTASGTLRVNPEYLPKATSYNTGKKYKGYGVCAVDGTSTYTNQIGVISVNTQNLEKASVDKYGDQGNQ